MGLFSNFGIYSAAMIALSLIASLVLTTAALGILAMLMRDNEPTTGIQMIDESVSYTHLTLPTKDSV
mgnify:CR=1 FL=1